MDLSKIELEKQFNLLKHLFYVKSQYTKIKKNPKANIMGGKLSQPNLQKKIEHGQNTQIKFCGVSMQGWQIQMEDSLICCINIDGNKKNGNSLFAVFDGIRGFQVSYFVKETFLSVLVNSEAYIEGNYEDSLKHTFQKVDELIRSEKGQKRLKQIRAQNHGQVQIANEIISDTTGCMASVILLTKKNIYAAHIGDSKAFLMRDKNYIALFEDHTLDSIDQKIRIQKAGGQVVQGQINGNLSVSRAFGFFSFKQNPILKWDQQIVTSFPTIKSFDRTVSDDFIMMGCDGVWAPHNKDLDLILKKTKQDLQKADQGLKNYLSQFFDKSISETLNKQNAIGTKNMTSIIVKFSQL